LNKNKRKEDITKKEKLLNRKEMSIKEATEYFDCYLSAVVGTITWKEKSKIDLARDIATIQDEAFCMVVLDNSYDRWVSMLNDPENKDNWEEAKYTKRNKDGKNEGWLNKGLEAYETFVDNVAELRKKDEDNTDNRAKDLEEQYKEAKKREGKTKRKRSNDEIFDSKTKIKGETNEHLPEEIKNMICNNRQSNINEFENCDY